ncbi:hypothetical protein [Porphyromonas sp.]
MDNLTTDFLSFFVPYMGFILLSLLVLSLALSEHHILAARYYYARKWERVVSETIREKDEAKREVELLRNTKTAEIERMTKKVATLEGELSALRANLSKHNEL